MSLREKFAAIFLLLLIAPIIAVTAPELDRTIAVMVEDLGDSASLLIDLTFEQVRGAASGASADMITALRGSHSLQALIGSAQAFGKGVVYLRIEKLDGTIIAGEPVASLGRSGFAGAPPSFGDLQAIANEWWPLGAIRALWASHTYEIDRHNDDALARLQPPQKIAPRFEVGKLALAAGLDPELLHDDLHHLLEAQLGIAQVRDAHVFELARDNRQRERRLARANLADQNGEAARLVQQPPLQGGIRFPMLPAHVELCGR